MVKKIKDLLTGVVELIQIVLYATYLLILNKIKEK